MSNLLDHLEKLKYFQAISEVSSFHRASKVLNVSQSGLSHSIKTLEDVMEVRLFNRSPKGVSLTESGEELLIFTNKLIKDVNRFERSFKDRSYNSSLVIGTYDTISVYFIPDLLNKLKNKDLSLELEIEKSNKRLIQLTLNGDIDISFMAEASTEKGLVTKKILDESYNFFISPNIKFPKKIEISIFEQYPLLYFPQAIAGRNVTLDRSINGNKMKIFNKISLSSFESIKSMTVEGLGVGLMPTRVGEKEVGRGTLKKIEIKGLPSNFGKHYIHACWREDFSEKVRPITKEL